MAAPVTQKTRKVMLRGAESLTQDPTARKRSRKGSPRAHRASSHPFARIQPIPPHSESRGRRSEKWESPEIYFSFDKVCTDLQSGSQCSLKGRELLQLCPVALMWNGNF